MSGSFDDVFRQVIISEASKIFTDFFRVLFVAVHLFYLLNLEDKILLGIIYLAGYLLFGLTE
jgi:hypothetical protein